MWRFQGRLVELDEVEIPLHPRYVAIGVWLVVTPVLVACLWPFGLALGVVGSGLYGAIIAWRLADFITGEVTLWSWIGIISSEISALRRSRRDRLPGTPTVGALTITRTRGMT